MVRTLGQEIDDMEAEMWGLIKKVNDESYKNKWEQHDDIDQIHRLSENIRALWKAQSIIGLRKTKTMEKP